MIKNTGGHNHKGHVSEFLLDLFKRMGCKSLLDVGCGVGHNVALAREKFGYEAYGIEGDADVFEKPLCSNIFKHDFERDGTFTDDALPRNIDLVWSVSVSEHIEQDKVLDYLDVFKRGRYVVFTWCPLDYQGYHHVNCQEAPYWIDKFRSIGFDIDQSMTKVIKERSNLVMVKSAYWRDSSFNQKRVPKMYLNQWGLCFKKQIKATT
jgi:SAM-dependent methyltransferase|tara:strand:- start:32 stop:652 length:621 start_codon:yes stop_codon:yes gene_type:complete